MIPCLSCGTLSRGTRCLPCRRAAHRPYGRVIYTSQPATGTCHICHLPIKAGQGSRDHLVPLAVNPDSTATLPAHRTCNYRRGARPLKRTRMMTFGPSKR